MAAEIIFGWPAAFVSILAALIALAGRWPKILLVALLIATPFQFYLAATPRFRVPAILAFACFATAVLALRKQREALALTLVLPFLGLVAVVAYVVLL